MFYMIIIGINLNKSLNYKLETRHSKLDTFFQYFATSGLISSAQARMPPLRL